MSKYFFIAIIWTIILISLTLLSKGTFQKFAIVDFVGIDKIGHLVFYSILSFLWANALIKFNENYYLFYIFFFCAILGVGLEYLQKTLTDGRTFEYLDMIANSIGTLIGLVFFQKIKLSFFNL